MADDQSTESSYLPIVYVRGYAGTQADVEETVDDPFYGFNLGSTHIRVDSAGDAQFYAFESPFVRLLTEHGYRDVFDGITQRITSTNESWARTVWIYRYYDPTSQTYDRPGGRRLSIEEAAEGLREFIQSVKSSTQAPKVLLIAHSMGGLVCRSLLQRSYPNHAEHGADHVDKLFTYGTPHGGIHFTTGASALERLRDLFGVNQSDDFGRQRIYEYLTPDAVRANNGANVPDSFEAAQIPASAFDIDRVFCVVGTNAKDYEVAKGLSRTLVGPQSDGLVQIDSAYVVAAPRAYIHRSHSGRYGMVNSEEGYQNLRRFFFGDVRVHMVLCDFELDYSGNTGGRQVTYQFEIQVTVRGSLVIMHERSEAHFCPVPLNQQQYLEQMTTGGLPLFTTFMISRLQGGSLRYMARLAVYSRVFERGLLQITDHVERLPLWSDYLVAELRPAPSGAPYRYEGYYNWASTSIEPDLPVPVEVNASGTIDGVVPLPERGQRVLGSRARVRLATSNWS